MSPAPRFGGRNRRPAATRTAADPALRPLTAAEMTADAAREMPEDVLQGHVAKLCKRYAVRHYHTHDSRRSPAGWPDSAMVGANGFMVRELKREGEKPTPIQQGWLDDLQAAGINVGVWRPTDLHTGLIEREIAALAGREQEAARLLDAMAITRAVIRRRTTQGDPK